ncbi:MAG: hypothetical protein GF384_04400 [Elusimicrobia bacterium]|nr:hypothetical protein [Elusimicrobiota bacterium]
MYSSGINALLGNGIREEPNFNDIHGVIEYIYSWMPLYIVVYPTEGFYYFNTRLHGEKVIGNIRIADLDKGLMASAYFTSKERYKITEVSDHESLKIEKVNDNLYYLTVFNKTVRIKIPNTAFMPPNQMEKLSCEEFIGQVHDDSGIRFFLLFNHNTDSFYYILNEEDKITDELKPLKSPFVVGLRTGFVYYYDDDFDRKILIAVRVDNTLENNYLDGPQDHVPYRAKIRDFLYRAYPSAMLEGGTDEYGVVLNSKEWARYAIAPFMRYNHYGEIYLRTKKWLNKKNKSILWTGLTKEQWNTLEYFKTTEEKLKEEGKLMPHNKWAEYLSAKTHKIE